MSITERRHPARARSSSPPTPSSCWRRRRPTPRIRPSPSSSCRPNIVAEARRHAGDAAARARRASRRSGRRILPCVEGETRRRDRSSRPTAPASSAAAASVRTPIAVIDGRPLSNTVGTVLDPIFALRRRVRIPPGATVRVAFWTAGRAVARATCSTSPTSIATPTAFERAATLAWTQAQVQLRHLGIDAGRGAACSSASPATCSTRTRRCGPRPTRSARGSGGPHGALGPGHFRRPADRAACGSTTSRTSASCASCCARTSTGG